MTRTAVDRWQSFVPDPREPTNPQVTAPIELSTDEQRDAGTETPPPRYEVCARPGCNEAFEVRTGPGRPQRYHNATCRRASTSGSRPAPVDEPASPPTAFSRTLDEAIRGSTLTLRAICATLAAEDGVSLSASTLSNWRSGRVPEERSDRNDRVYGLERVLRLDRGSLLLQLDRGTPAPAAPEPSPRRPSPHQALVEFRDQLGRLGGVGGYVSTRVSESCVIGPDCRRHHRRVRQTTLATEDDTDAYWLLASADRRDTTITLQTIKGCRLGRQQQQGALRAYELLFDRTLGRGETHTFTYQLGFPEETELVPFIRRWTSPPGQPALDHFDLEVHFQNPPRQVWECRWPTEAGAPVDVRPVGLGDGRARLTMAHPVPGLIGLRWE